MSIIDHEDDGIIHFVTEEDVVVFDEENEGGGSDEYLDDEENIFDESLINRRLEARLRAYDEGDPDAIRRLKEDEVSTFVMWLKRSRTVGNFKFDILSMLTFSPTRYKASKKILTDAKKNRSLDSEKDKDDPSISKEERRAIILEEQKRHVHYTKFWSIIWEEVFSKWFLSVLILFLVIFGVTLKVVFSSISAMRHGGSKLWYVMLIVIMLEIAWNCFKHLRAAWVIAVEKTEATIASRAVDTAKKAAEKKTEAKKERKRQQISSASEQSTNGPIRPSRRGHNRWSGGNSTTTP